MAWPPTLLGALHWRVGMGVCAETIHTVLYAVWLGAHLAQEDGRVPGITGDMLHGEWVPWAPLDQAGLQNAVRGEPGHEDQTRGAGGSTAGRVAVETGMLREAGVPGVSEAAALAAWLWGTAGGAS